MGNILCSQDSSRTLDHIFRNETQQYRIYREYERKYNKYKC